MNNVQGTGRSAPNPLSQSDAQPRVAKPNPEQILQGWMPKSQPVYWNISHALSELAHGRLANDEYIQKAFCLLLNEGEFDKCLDVFEAHRTVRQAAAGGRVTAALRLTVPADWNPDLNKLEALFKRLRVDSLTVDAVTSTFPAAGCHCIAILLKGGLSELAVGGHLAEPELVAQAFANCQLESIVFLGSTFPLHLESTPASKKISTTVSVLTEGLHACSTLVSLAIHGERLLEMQSCWRKLMTGRPALQTLAVFLKMLDFKQDAWHIVSGFMHMVRETNAFTAITVTAGPGVFGLDAGDVHTAIFMPLKEHPRLSSLELRSMPGLTGSERNMRSQHCSTLFAERCLSLEYFVWEANASQLSIAFLREFQAGGGDVQMTNDAEHVGDAVKVLLPRMKKMVLIGHPLTTGPINAFALERGGMASGMDLDLRGSLIEVASAIKLAAAWKKDPTRGKLLLPASLDRYYLLQDGRDIWGIAENAARNGFLLTQAGGLDQAACDRAVATFDALKDALLDMMRDIRQQLVQSTSPLLESNVQAFMQAALRSALPNIQGVSNDAFSLAAQTIVELLVKEERVPTAVRVAAVNEGIHYAHKTSLDRLNVPYGRFDLRSDTKQLVHMEKDRHAALMEAVELCDMKAVDKLLSDGAIDIGGRALQRAQQLVKEGRLLPMSLGIFQKHVPKFASNTSVTTINTTTTTTTTGTTGTLGTTTTAAQVVAVDEAWKAWEAEIPPDAPDLVVAHLQALTRGVLPDPVEMQQVFLCLLEKGAFDLFVEAFNTCCAMQRVAAEALHAPPFKSLLSLELPRDWAPDIDKLNAALQRIQVDTLRLTAPPEQTASYPAVPQPAQAAKYPNVSQAACHLVASLLKGGTTVLHIGGVLANPGLVAQAMRQSQLRSLTLLGMPDWTMNGRLEMEAYEALAFGVTGCATLTELAIRDERLFALHLRLAKYLKAGPKLNTLEVSLGTSMDRSQITSFMRLANRLPALSKVKVHFDVDGSREHPSTAVGVNRVQGAIFSPLTGNSSLTTLDMGRMPMSVDSPTIMTAVPRALVFAASCPSLKHVSWAAIPLAKLTVKRLQAFVSAGADMDMTTASTQIAKAYSRPDANLTTVSLTNFVLPPGPMQAWSAAMAGNRSLRQLDLSGCLMDAQSAATLFSSLQQNPLFETLKVSTNYSDYYFHFEGLIWAIAQKSDGSGLELLREGQPDDALDQRAAVAFKAVEHGLRKLVEMSLAHTTQGVAEAEDS